MLDFRLDFIVNCYFKNASVLTVISLYFLECSMYVKWNLTDIPTKTAKDIMIIPGSEKTLHVYVKQPTIVSW